MQLSECTYNKEHLLHNVQVNIQNIIFLNVRLKVFFFTVDQLFSVVEIYSLRIRRLSYTTIFGVNVRLNKRERNKRVAQCTPMHRIVCQASQMLTATTVRPSKMIRTSSRAIASDCIIISVSSCE